MASDIPARTRQAVYDRDRTCRAYGSTPPDDVDPAEFAEAWTALIAVRHDGGRQVHHVVRRQVGGRDLANLLLLCAAHHQWVTEHPRYARVLGLIRSAHDVHPVVGLTTRPDSGNLLDMDTPALARDFPDWTIIITPDRESNMPDRWKVAARRGSIVITDRKLTRDEVAGFDPVAQARAAAAQFKAKLEAR